MQVCGVQGYHVFKGFAMECQIALQKRETLYPSPPRPRAPKPGLRGLAPHGLACAIYSSQALQSERGVSLCRGRAELAGAVSSVSTHAKTLPDSPISHPLGLGGRKPRSPLALLPRAPSTLEKQLGPSSRNKLGREARSAARRP